MPRVTVKIIDATKLPADDPRRASAPPWGHEFLCPDLPIDVGCRNAVRTGGLVAVDLINPTDADRDDVKAAIASAQ